MYRFLSFLDDSVVFLFKAFVLILMGIPVLSPFLTQYGFNLDFFYFGVLGQTVALLMFGRGRLKDKTVKLKLSLRATLAVLVELLLGGVIAMVAISSAADKFPEFPVGLLAVILGAFFQPIFHFIEDKVAYFTKRKDDVDSKDI